MSERPGVLIYFDDVRPFLNRSDDKTCGALFRAIIEYAQYGVIPDNLDPLSGMAFEMLKPKIDRDSDSYKKKLEKTALAGEYSAYKAAETKANRKPLCFEDWKQQKKTYADISPTGTNICSTNVDRREPTAIAAAEVVTIPTSAVKAIPEVNTKAFTLGAGEVAAGGCKGDGEGEPIRILKEQWHAALDAKKMTLAMDISNQLFRAGYNTNPNTREVSPRTR